MSLPALLVILTGCASAGSSWGSGVADRLLDAPPYYAGSQNLPPTHRIAHLPIEFQAGATQPAVFEPSAADRHLIALIGEMNTYVDGLRRELPLRAGFVEGAVAPDVRFGCEPVSVDECQRSDDDAGSTRHPWMLLTVARPSPQWIEAVARALEAAGKEHVLVIRLEVGQYWTYQKNWRGSKELRLGTGHIEAVPWLTSLDQPVQVLQLTGALLDRHGRAARIGAEGLISRRTNIFVAGLGGQALIGDEDVARLLSERRHDLSGDPYVWQVALENLVRQLTGDGVMR